MNKAATTGAAIGDEAAEHMSGGEILKMDAVSWLQASNEQPDHVATS